MRMWAKTERMRVHAFSFSLTERKSEGGTRESERVRVRETVRVRESERASKWVRRKESERARVRESVRECVRERMS